MPTTERLLAIATEMERSVEALKQVGCDDAELLAGNETIARDLRAAADEWRKTRRAKNEAYAERDRLVCALSKLFPAWLGRHPDSDTAWENDWRWIVFVQLPTGHCTWHIHDTELHWFAHLPRTGAPWDGHTTEQKYQRLGALNAGPSLVQEPDESPRCATCGATSRLERPATLPPKPWRCRFGEGCRANEPSYDQRLAALEAKAHAIAAAPVPASPAHDISLVQEPYDSVDFPAAVVRAIDTLDDRVRALEAASSRLIEVQVVQWGVDEPLAAPVPVLIHVDAIETCCPTVENDRQTHSCITWRQAWPKMFVEEPYPALRARIEAASR